MFFYSFSFLMTKKKNIFILFIFLSANIYSQSIRLKNYEWHHRILLVISEDETTPLYQQQLKEFQKDNLGSSERKLVLFDIKKDKFREMSYLNSVMVVRAWVSSNALYNQFYEKEVTLKVVLIGLDGGVKKVYKNELLKKETLFSIIDGMSLRRQELKRKNTTRH